MSPESAAYGGSTTVLGHGGSKLITGAPSKTQTDDKTAIEA